MSAQRLRPVIETLLAATAVAHELIIVTRNTSDVQDIKVKLLIPWKSGIEKPTSEYPDVRHPD